MPTANNPLTFAGLFAAGRIKPANLLARLHL